MKPPEGFTRLWRRTVVGHITVPEAKVARPVFRQHYQSATGGFSQWHLSVTMTTSAACGSKRSSASYSTGTEIPLQHAKNPDARPRSSSVSTERRKRSEPALPHADTRKATASKIPVRSVHASQPRRIATTEIASNRAFPAPRLRFGLKVASLRRGSKSHQYSRRNRDETCRQKAPTRPRREPAGRYALRHTVAADRGPHGNDQDQAETAVDNPAMSVAATSLESMSKLRRATEDPHATGHTYASTRRAVHP